MAYYLSLIVLYLYTKSEKNILKAYVYKSCSHVKSHKITGMPFLAHERYTDHRHVGKYYEGNIAGSK